jgi:signal peptidase I
MIAHRLQPYAFFAEENLSGVEHPVMGLRGAGAASRNFPTVTVPPDRYFLMGDSRDNSRDSREFGFAKREAILGKAEGIVVSLDINDTYLPRAERFFSALR